MHRHSHLVPLLLRTSAYCKQILSSLSNTLSFFDTSNYIIFRFDSRYNDAGSRILAPIPFISIPPVPTPSTASTITKQLNYRLNARRFIDTNSIQHDADRDITSEIRKSMETGQKEDFERDLDLPVPRDMIDEWRLFATLLEGIATISRHFRGLET